MKTKYTPGPWFVKYGCTIYGSDRYFVAVSEGVGCQHAEQDDNGLSINRSEEEADANIRLIAAAPELLDALESLVALGLRQEFREFEKWEEVEFARYVIAKATGEQL